VILAESGGVTYAYTSPAPFVVTGDNATANFTVELSPPKTIAGTITYEDESSASHTVEGALVTFTSLDIPTLAPITDTTDDNGEFEIVALAGNYKVEIIAIIEGLRVPYGLKETYEVTVDNSAYNKLITPLIYTVSGKVEYMVGSVATAIEDATVTFTNTDTNMDSPADPATTIGDGSYSLQVPHGTYDVSVRGIAGGLPYGLTLTNVDIHDTKAGFDHMTTPIVYSVSGVLKLDLGDGEEPEPVGGARITLKNVDTTMNSPATVTSSNAEGTLGEFTLPVVAEGDYLVEAIINYLPYYYDDTLEVRGAITGRDITVVPYHLHTLTGTVVYGTSETPLVGATVTYTNAEAGEYSPQPVTTTTSGAFTIRTVTGEYNIYVEGTVEGVRYTYATTTAVTVATNDNTLAFTATSAPAPLPAILTRPSNGGVAGSLTPTLTWAPDLTGEAPNSYKVYFGTTQPLTEPPIYTGANTTFAITTQQNLQYSTTYYWQVVPSNYGIPADDCEVWSFTTIGRAVGATGTGGVDMPMGPGYNFASSQVIYTQAELAQAGILGKGEITHLYYQANGNGVNLDANNNAWHIYMGTTDTNNFPGANDLVPSSATDLIPTSAMSLVKEGVVATANLAGGEWVRIELDDPFEYPGSGNIVIYVNEYSPGHTGSISNPWNAWYASNVGVNRAFQGLDDATAFDPTDTSSWIAGARKNFYNARPNLAVTFAVDASAPLPAVLVSPAIGAIPGSLTPTLSWSADRTGAQPSSYKVYFGAAEDELELRQTVTTPTYTITTALLPSTTYYWKVVPSNATGEADGAECEVWSFETRGLVVGAATNGVNTALPMSPNNNYTVSEVIYTETELTAAGILGKGTISHIYYQANGNMNFADGNTNDLLIYMGITNKSSFVDDNDWIQLAEMTEVKGQPNLTH